MPRRRVRHALSLAAVLAAASVSAGCATRPAPEAQRAFPTPDLAANALVAAAVSGSESDLAALFGPDWKAVAQSSDARSDREAMRAFSRLAVDGGAAAARMSDGRVVLCVGAGKWPFPVPLSRDAAGLWRFDTAAGGRELRNRRIGMAELSASSLCRSLADGRAAPPPDAVDALHGWTAWGYHFKLLPRKGPSAPGGLLPAGEGGRGPAAYGVLAWPVAYGVSGVKSFAIGVEGILYEKDMGPATAAEAPAIDIYEPDDTWTPSGA